MYKCNEMRHAYSDRTGVQYDYIMRSVGPHCYTTRPADHHNLTFPPPSPPPVSVCVCRLRPDFTLMAPFPRLEELEFELPDGTPLVQVTSLQEGGCSNGSSSSFYRPISLFIYPSICLSTYLFNYLPIHVSTLSIYFNWFTAWSLCLFQIVHTSVCCCGNEDWFGFGRSDVMDTYLNRILHLGLRTREVTIMAVEANAYPIKPPFPLRSEEAHNTG